MKKIISSVLKSFLIFVTIFLLFCLYLFKQTEYKLRDFYQQRDFKGKVELQSIAPKFNGTKVEIKSNFVYTEVVDKKEQKIKMTMTLPLVNLVLPYYEGEHEEPEPYTFVTKRYHYYFREAYDPIFQRALDLNPQLPQLEKQIKNALAGIPYFEGMKFKIVNFSYLKLDRQDWSTSVIKKNFENGEKRLGGAYQISLLEALANEELIIIFEVKERPSGGHFTENITKAIQNGLPDGSYVIESEEAAHSLQENDYSSVDRARIKDGKLSWR